MTHHTDDTDPLKALRDELAEVAPSPQFAVRVRQRIGAVEERRPASWMLGLRWLVPTAAAAALLMAVLVWSNPGTNPGVVDAVITRAPIETPGARSAPAESSSGIPMAAKVEPDHPGTRAPEHLRTSALAEAPTDTREPDLEVLTDQPAILRALWARVATGATLVESIPVVLPDAVPEIVVRPIEVSPIEIKWLGDPETAPGAFIIRK